MTCLTKRSRELWLPCVGEQWTWFIDHMSDEIRFVTGAPVLSVTGLLFAIAIAYVLARARYHGIVANLKSVVDLRNEQLADSQNKLSGAQRTLSEPRPHILWIQESGRFRVATEDEVRIHAGWATPQDDPSTFGA